VIQFAQHGRTVLTRKGNKRMPRRVGIYNLDENLTLEKAKGYIPFMD